MKRGVVDEQVENRLHERPMHHAGVQVGDDDLLVGPVVGDHGGPFAHSDSSGRLDGPGTRRPTGAGSRWSGELQLHWLCGEKLGGVQLKEFDRPGNLVGYALPIGMRLRPKLEVVRAVVIADTIDVVDSLGP